MKERALMMGGVFDIQSRPGEGTILWIKIPIRNQNLSIAGL
jgi:signal transduction histidine kinase